MTGVSSPTRHLACHAGRPGTALQQARLRVQRARGRGCPPGHDRPGGRGRAARDYDRPAVLRQIRAVAAGAGHVGIGPLPGMPGAPGSVTCNFDRARWCSSPSCRERTSRRSPAIGARRAASVTPDKVAEVASDGTLATLPTGGAVIEPGACRGGVTSMWLDMACAPYRFMDERKSEATISSARRRTIQETAATAVTEAALRAWGARRRALCRARRSAT